MHYNQFIVHTQKGYYCAVGDFYLDPRQPVKHAVISHAHADHAIPGHTHIYCTEPTMSFMSHRYKRMDTSTFITQAYHQPFMLNEVKLLLIPAGHMLGSAMVWMEYKGVKYLYTGDFKLQQDNSCEAFTTIEADVLITETTFAKPDVVHDEPEQAISVLNNLPDTNVLIGAYMLGKAQHLQKLLSTYCPRYQVHVHGQIMPFSRIYESYGVSLGAYQTYDAKELRKGKNHVVIVPPAIFSKYNHRSPFIRAFATGWDKPHAENTIALRISDHADWPQLLELIRVVKPRHILTVHGNGNELVRAFENSIISVEKLAKAGQTNYQIPF